MHDFRCPDTAPEPPRPPERNRAPLPRRRVLGAMGASAAVLAAADLLRDGSVAQAAQAAASRAPLSVILLGTNGGPPPLAARSGISSALVVNGKTYVIDCGRGSLTQYVRAGLTLPPAAIFLTHLHSDHTADYFSYPLLSATTGPFGTFDVYGPGPAGEDSLVPSVSGPVPGTAGLTSLANQAFAASTTFFLAEDNGVDPASLVTVHEILPPARSGASLADPAPAMAPFPVLENSDVRVSAILVPHGAVYPAYAYRFDTEYGSVVFSGDTSPTPNIISLARDADLLVHEVVDLAVYQTLGLPPPLLAHLQSVHTDVTDLGRIAAASRVRKLLATHLGPGDPAIISGAAWKRALHDSARQGHFRGPVILGEDLMQMPVTRRHP